MQEINLTGPVGAGLFNIKQVESLAPGPVHVVINSPGGDMSTAFGIYKVLRERPGKITVHIVNAESAASLVAMAGDYRTMRVNGTFLIHNAAWARGGGSPAGIAGLADVNAAAAGIYTERSRLRAQDVCKLMSAELRLSAWHACEYGFVHKVGK